MRKATIQRDTKETQISVEVNLDGQGVYEIESGIGFFDHMLEQLAKHSSIDIKLVAKGDLHVDFHHTAEDSAIALGSAIKKALGDKRGIERYSQAYVPMDETLTRVVIDICGRVYPVWNVKFDRDKIGDMDSELFREFFIAFAGSLGCNLHVQNLYGVNNHHIVESCFKGLARCLKGAVKIDPKRANDLPSTKGSL